MPWMTKGTLVLLLLGTPFPVYTQDIITTVAGNGTQGFSGDGGPATSASLSGPVGVALDGAGNLYIADRINDRIRKVNPAGIISTVAGNGIRGFSGDGGPAAGARAESRAATGWRTCGGNRSGHRTRRGCAASRPPRLGDNEDRFFANSPFASFDS